jgi:glycosyltransferase involved in cell wall biosynthesis
MEKVLFVISSLLTGGAEKSLISLLDTIDYDKYQVDLLVICPTGNLYNLLNKNVNLIDSNILGYPFQASQKVKFWYLLRSINIKSILKLSWNRIYKNKQELLNRTQEQETYQAIKSSIKMVPGNYDIAIGYLESMSNYIVIDKVIAKKKLIWIHTDYVKAKLNKYIDKYYYNKANYIITISNECSDILKTVFPEFKQKIKVFPNLINKGLINKLSCESIGDERLRSIESLKLVTVARPCKSKGIEIAIETCKYLKEYDQNFTWIYVGRLTDQKDIISTIYSYNLEDNLILLGESLNPYQYIKWSDIYVHPSLIEGKSIAIEEAKCVKKPIILTPFETANSHLQNNVTGIISSFSPKEIANDIIMLYENKDLQKKFVSSLEIEESEETSKFSFDTLLG